MKKDRRFLTTVEIIRANERPASGGKEKRLMWEETSSCSNQMAFKEGMEHMESEIRGKGEARSFEYATQR
uniref:Uncharacterized protein n=1 Tax=Setaria digitata TaxID=48799 RepID=A0A915PZN3_9BILA